MRSQFLYLLIAALFALIGCKPSPQAIDSSNIGFGKDEYIIIEVKDIDQLGLLFVAHQKNDEKGMPLPLRWRETAVVLFPEGKVYNRVRTSKAEQTRSVFGTVKTSSQLTASVIADLKLNNQSAIKYNSRSSEAIRMISPLKYNPKAKTYMQELSNDPNIRFSYMSALYEGISYIETLNSIETSNNVGYAAYKIGRNYYTTNNIGWLNNGYIIYSLKQISIDELIEPLGKAQKTIPSTGNVEKPVKIFESLTNEELRASENLLINGGFEQDHNAWGTGYIENKFKGIFEIYGGFWITRKKLPDGSFKNANVSAKLDSKIKRSGKNSFKIIMNSPREPNIYGSMSQRIDGLMKNTKYIACFWVKAESAQKDTFQITIDKDWTDYAQIDEDTYEWRKFEHTFNSGDNTSIDFRIVSAGPGTVWVDDISFKRYLPDNKHE